MHAPATSIKLDEVVNSPDPFKTFLNAYGVCKANNNHDLFFNLLQSPLHNQTFRAKTEELMELLAASQPIQLMHVESPDPRKCLLHVFAILKALAIHIGKEFEKDLALATSLKPIADSTGKQYWLARATEPFGGAIPNPPRTIHEISNTLSLWHRPLLVTPTDIGKLTLKRVGRDKVAEIYLKKRLKRRQIRIAISPLSSEGKLQSATHRRDDLTPHFAFHVTSIQPEAEQIDALRETMQEAWEKGASILVLPELRMPPALLQAAKEFLKHQGSIEQDRGLLLVAAGSWHVKEGDDDVHRNRCHVLNFRGEELWRHDKLREYHMFEDGGGQEAILRGESLEFYDSVIGRVAVAICVGFFAKDLEGLLLESGANVFLVPAMTTSITDLESRAKELVRTQHAATFVANSAEISNGSGGPVGDKKGCFYQLPQKGAKPEYLHRDDNLLLFDLGKLFVKPK